MKTTTIFWGIIFLFATSCNQKKAEPAKHEHGDTTATMKQVGHDEAGLMLNDGKKWKIDEPTRINIGLIKQSFQKFAGEAKPDYVGLVAELQNRADKLVSECRMSGKDHDMLHIWLEKFLSSLKELKSPDLKTHENAFNKIDESLKGFDEYFE